MKLAKKDLVIETDLPSEIVTLKSQGFAEVKPESAPAPEPDEFDKGAELPAAPAVVTNKTDRAEVVKPAPKSTK